MASFGVQPFIHSKRVASGTSVLPSVGCKASLGVETIDPKPSKLP